MTTTDIINTVCDVFGLTESELCTKTKLRRICQPRILSIALTKITNPKMRDIDIGARFGLRRGGSLCYAVEQAEHFRRVDKDFNAKAKAVCAKLKGMK